MARFKLTLEYEGTRYSGWQVQKNARTVQGDLLAAMRDLFKTTEMELYGSGRTDAGVHALRQVAHLDVATMLAPEIIRKKINDELPADINMIEVEKAAKTFHARHDAIARSYVYQISRRKTAFSKKFVWWIKEPLDIARMAEAAALVAGRHDFTCFRAIDPSKPDEGSIVVVESCEVEEQPDSGLLLFRICGSHFLWRMVRRLAGTLVKVGLGQVTVNEFKQLLDGRATPKLDVAAWTAPASGLFLESVRYPAPSAEPRGVKKRK